MVHVPLDPHKTRNKTSHKNTKEHLGVEPRGAPPDGKMAVESPTSLVGDDTYKSNTPTNGYGYDVESGRENEE